MASNNIAFMRRSRNYTQLRLAEMTGIPFYILSKIELGNRGFEDVEKQIAKALNCKVSDLHLAAQDQPQISVNQIVKYRCFIKELPKDKCETIAAIPGLPKTAEAIKIAGTHLVPYFGAGDLLYIDSKPQKNENLFINRQCKVDIAGRERGTVMLAWISIGSKPERYMVHPYGMPMMVDVKIKAAYPVLLKQSA